MPSQFHKSRLISAATIATLIAGAIVPASAEVVVRGQEGRPLDEIRRAPASIYPDLHTIVAQPSPSEIQPEFLGPHLFMKSGHIDLERGTVTLPLRRGQLANGTPQWFIITDTSDENLSDLHGVNYSPKMAYGLTGNATRSATIQPNGSFTFARGAVDFRPAQALTPGAQPTPFPPASFQPGSVGDAFYTPLINITNAGKAVVMNAPVMS